MRGQTCQNRCCGKSIETRFRSWDLGVMSPARFRCAISMGAEELLMYKTQAPYSYCPSHPCTAGNLSPSTEILSSRIDPLEAPSCPTCCHCHVRAATYMSSRRTCHCEAAVPVGRCRTPRGCACAPWHAEARPGQCVTMSSDPIVGSLAFIRSVGRACC
jgi:hypothetical protein